MVAIRRIKYVVKLSAFFLFVLTFVIFLQWDEILYRERVRRYVSGLREQIGQSQGHEQSLVDSERDLNVDEVLQKIKEDVEFRLALEDELEIWRTTENASETGEHNKSFTEETHRDLHPSTTSPPSPLQPTLAYTKLTRTTGNPQADQQPLKSRGHDPRPVTWKPYPWEPQMRGQLNVHVWQAWCGNTIHDLRRNWFFPSYPDFKFTVRRFFVQHFENDYGQRIFGYLHAPLTGRYVFALSSDDSSEFWLSTDEDPKNVQLLTWVGNRTSLDGNYKTKVAQFLKYPSQISKPIYLEQGRKYFIEALHKQGVRDDHILVGWQIPGYAGFRFITGDSISMYIDDKLITSDVTEYAKFIPQNLPSHSHARQSNVILDHFQHKFGSGNSDNYSHMDRILSARTLRGVLPMCLYAPSYLVNFTLGRYDGVKLIHDSAVYPDDNTELTHMKPYDKCIARRLQDSHGNALKYLIPDLNNGSIYDEGRIQVLNRDDGVAVVASPEEWEDAYMRFYSREKKKKRNSGEDVKQGHGEKLKQVMTELFSNLGNMNKIPTPTSSEEERNSKLRLSVVNVNKENDNYRYPTTSKRVFAASINARESVVPRSRRALVRDSSSVKSASKIIRKRKSRNKVIKSKGMDAKSKSKVEKKIIRTRSRSKINKIDRIGEVDRRRRVGEGEREHPGLTPRQSAKSSPNRIQVGNPRSGRKLLSVSRDESNYRRKVQETREYILKQRGRAVQPLYSRQLPRQSRVFRHPEVAYRDTIFSRTFLAYEYIRRLQMVVQHYRYTISAKQVSSQIYRRFGVNISAPALFPVLEYDPWLYHHNMTKCTSDGNLMLSPDVAKSVVNRYMDILNMKTNNKYSLRRIINIEENHDVMNGDRYLLELELQIHGKRTPVRLSQYLYQKNGQETFCQPSSFNINEHATVHVIVPVKNQGRWVQYFIDDMSELYLRTQDPHLNVIIVDFDSDDINIHAALKRSALRRYHLIKLKGAFQRAYGIQAGASYVKNPRDIIFMCDLHLELPNNMIDIIRKHTVEGYMAFAPIVTRLHCGFTPSIPFGFWELQGYGLFAMYKSDFRLVGGMNYREFGTRWGGEDWELLDRVLANKMEVERLRIPNFYHFYHSKKGMWGTPTLDVASSDVPDYYSSENQIIPTYNEDDNQDDTTSDTSYVQIKADSEDINNMDTVKSRQTGKKRRPARMHKAGRKSRERRTVNEKRTREERRTINEKRTRERRNEE